MREARLAEVNLIVDHAGQQMQPGGVDRFVDAELRGGIDVGDARAFDDDRAAIGAVGEDDCGVFDEDSHGGAGRNARASPAAKSVALEREYRSFVGAASHRWRFGNVAALLRCEIVDGEIQSLRRRLSFCRRKPRST